MGSERSRWNFLSSLPWEALEGRKSHLKGRCLEGDQNLIPRPVAKAALFLPPVLEPPPINPYELIHCVCVLPPPGSPPIIFPMNPCSPPPHWSPSFQSCPILHSAARGLGLLNCMTNHLPLLPSLSMDFFCGTQSKNPDLSHHCSQGPAGSAPNPHLQPHSWSCAGEGAVKPSIHPSHLSQTLEHPHPSTSLHFSAI